MRAAEEGDRHSTSHAAAQGSSAEGAMRLPEIAAASLFVAVSSLAARPALAAPVTYALGPDASQIVVNVYKKGALSPFLHDHRFVADAWSGTVVFDPDAPASAHANVAIEAGSLRETEPGLSADDVTKIERQVSQDVLEAPRYPMIRFTADRFEVTASDPTQGLVRGVLHGSLTLHGVTQDVSVPVAAKLGGDGVLAVNGNTSLLQSEFGIRPYSKALGAVAVDDRVDIFLSLRATAK
jgi:polyisoprenoid-binding protein YceI